MDFPVWSILKSKACKKIHHTVDDLKCSLRRTWNEIPQEQLCATSERVRKRLEAKSNVMGAILNKIVFFAFY